MAKRITAADVKRTVKNSTRVDGRCYVNLVDGKPMFTQSNYAVAVRRGTPVWDYLDAANIDPEAPGTYVQNGALKPVPACDPPNIGQVIPAKDKRGKAIHAVELDGRPARVLSSADHLLTPYRIDAETNVYVQSEYVAIVEAVTRGLVVWYATTNLKPISGYDVDGDLVGVIMPVRV